MRRGQKTSAQRVWDDDGLECASCASANDILRHALSLLNGLPETDTAEDSHAVASVRDACGHVVLTATLKPNSEPSLRWNGEKLPVSAPVIPPTSTSAART